MNNSTAPGSSADVNVKVTALTTNPNVPFTYKTIILKKNLINGVNTLTQEMMSAQNTKYVIKYDYILGEDINISVGCILEFDGGSISASGSNDTITGNNTIIIGENNLFNNIIIGEGIFYYKNIVSSEIFKTWNSDSTLNSLVNLCREGSTIMFDRGLIVTVYNGLQIRKNITLEGNNSTIIFANKNNESYSDTFLSIENVSSFRMNALTIDGNADNQTGGTHKNKHFIQSIGTAKIEITNCSFRNIVCDFGSEFNTNPNTYFMYFETYDNIRFDNVIISDVTASEGIGMYPKELEQYIPHTNREDIYYPIFTNIENYFEKYSLTKNYVEISNCSFKYNMVSSAIILFFGRINIKNNTFFLTRGGTLNCMCYDSVIENNTFKGSALSSLIDLSEGGTFNFTPLNVKITNNYGGNASGGCIATCNIKDSVIENNVFDPVYTGDTSYFNFEFDFTYDLSFSIFGYIRNVKINNNTINGSKKGLLRDVLEMTNVLIINNFINNSIDIKNATLQVRTSQNLNIRNNTFVNTGNSNDYFQQNFVKEFIVLLGISEERLHKNVYIDNNIFVFQKQNVNCSIVNAVSYDFRNNPILPILENINITNNICNGNNYCVLESDVANGFDFAETSEINIKGNSINWKCLYANIPLSLDFQFPEDTLKYNKDDVYYTGCVVSKNQIIKLFTSSSDQYPRYCKATKNTIYCAKEIKVGDNLQKGWIQSHNGYCYFCTKNVNIAADFTDNDRISEYGLIRIGAAQIWYDGSVFYPLNTPQNRGDDRNFEKEKIKNASENIFAGYQYFDTTLGKPIWWNGTEWVDATGVTV